MSAADDVPLARRLRDKAVDALDVGRAVMAKEVASARAVEAQILERRERPLEIERMR